MASQNKFKAYYQLTKPGIIYGNILTAVAGFLLASKWHINWTLLAGVLVGMSLVIASACVFNNYIDRGIDKLMVRTKQRALVSGLISPRNALIYATILGLTGFAVLLRYVNVLTASLGLFAFVDYVVLYGLAKRRSVHGTIVGSIAGAMPPVAGYTAVTNRLDTGAVLLFLILVCWQMPHFYSIAMYRFKDYKKAGLPVLPVKKGAKATKLQILLYIMAFTALAGSLTIFSYTGLAYLGIVIVLCSLWFWKGIKGLETEDDTPWARKMFLFSLIVITGLSVALAVGAVLP